jgi:hypothetical protein
MARGNAANAKQTTSNASSRSHTDQVSTLASRRASRAKRPELSSLPVTAHAQHTGDHNTEVFDLDVVDEGDSEDGDGESSAPATVNTMAQVNQAADPTNCATVALAVLLPSGTDGSSSGSTARDVNYFFRRGSRQDPTSKMVCIRCE